MDQNLIDQNNGSKPEEELKSIRCLQNAGVRTWGLALSEEREELGSS
jgi:hypothetical protein